MVSNTSGASGIAVWVNQHLKLTGPAAIDKHDPLILGLKKWVDDQYAAGRVTSITDGELTEEMERIIREQGEGGRDES